MAQDEIIKLAMEYGFTGGFDADGNLTFDATFVEAVAEAVAKTRKATLEEMIYEHPTIAIKKAVEYAVKAERYQCYILMLELHSLANGNHNHYHYAANKIQERGEQHE